MNNYQQLQKNLHELKLTQISLQIDDYINKINEHKLSIVDALCELTSKEVEVKNFNAAHAMVKVAAFPHLKELKDFDFEFQPKINKQQFLDFESLRFLDNNSNIILIGNSGVGKTHFSPNSTLTRAQAVVMLYRYEAKFASGGTETNPSTEIPTKPDGTTKTYTGADVTAEYKSKAVGALGSYFEVNVPVGQKAYFKVSDSSGKILGVNIKDCNGFYNHTTDIGFVGIDVDSSSVMVEGYKSGTMVVNLFKSDETNGTLSTVVIRVGGSTCSVAITTPSGTSTNPGGTGNQGGEFDYNSVDFNANMDIRNEIVRLTNEVRKENGVSELPTDSAVMNAAQAAAEYYAMSGDGWNGHNSQVERDCRKKAGMTYGSMTNLTGSTSSNRSTVAKESVTNWVNSDVHFQAMIDATADNIGVGVAIDANGYFWCVQVFGDYESIS